MNVSLSHNQARKRQWIYPLIRKGQLYKYRSLLSYFYLILFFAGPFLSISGQPVLLLNIIDRQFIILGQVFWPQDIFLFVLATLTFIVCIVLFTIAFGRLFCGWICPQTIFMEMVFRKIEVLIEGNAPAQKKLSASPLTAEKIMRKGSKHLAFLLISFLIANTFLAYIIGRGPLLKIITEPLTQHISGFVSICIFTLVFYLVYSQVRELVCTVICPYGRLQGVLIDQDTLVVAYNEPRGEPRRKIKHSDHAEENSGDCIDCGLCVSVCPTGIDIRSGTQLECINCTACIDVCNQVMKKIDRKPDLIGFFSEKGIHQQLKPSFTGRMSGYTAIIIVLIALLSYFTFSRTDMDFTVMRSPGMLYQEQPMGMVSNIYNAEIINKSDKTREITIQPVDRAVKITYIQSPGKVAGSSAVKTVFFLLIHSKDIHAVKTEVTLKLLFDKRVMKTIHTTFIGPITNKI